MNIYIDESGDLGSRKSGKYFIIILATNHDANLFNTFIRRLKSRKLHKDKRKWQELKASSASVKILDYFFEKVQELDFSLYCIILDKTIIPLKFKDEQGVIYLHMVEKGLEYIRKFHKHSKEIYLFLDSRHMQKLTHIAFNLNLRKKFLFEKDRTTRLEINHVTSHSSGGIQFVDFLAYALYLKYNKSDDKYYRKIKSKITKKEIIKLPK